MSKELDYMINFFLNWTYKLRNVDEMLKFSF